MTDPRWPDDDADSDDDEPFRTDDPDDPVTSLGAHERRFTGACGRTIDDLTRTALTQFARLVTVVDPGQPVPDDAVDEVADVLHDLGFTLLHLQEHLANGVTPAAWVDTSPLQAIMIAPAHGLWIERALDAWITLARDYGVPGLRRCSLPWHAPLNFAFAGSNGQALSLNIDLRHSRAVSTLDWLDEFAAVPQDRADTLAAALDDKATLDDAACAVTDLLFDADETSRPGAPVTIPDHLSDTPTDDVYARPHSDDGPEHPSLLVHGRDYTYDWASGVSVAWLTWMSVLEVLSAAPHLTRIVEDDVTWDFPSPDIDGDLFINPWAVYHSHSGGEIGDANPDTDADVDPDGDETEETDDAESAVWLAGLLGPDGRVAVSPLSSPGNDRDFPIMTEYLEADDQDNVWRLNAVVAPVTGDTGLRLAFRSVPPLPCPYPIVPSPDTFPAGVRLADTIAGTIADGSGLWWATSTRLLQQITLLLNEYATSGAIPIESGDDWLVAMVAATRTATQSAVHGLRATAAELLPAASHLDVTLTAAGNDITGVTFLADTDAATVVRVTGADLDRADAVFSDLRASAQVLLAARDLHAQITAFGPGLHDLPGAPGDAGAMPVLTAAYDSDGNPVPLTSTEARRIRFALTPDPGWAARLDLVALHHAR